MIFINKYYKKQEKNLIKKIYSLINKTKLNYLIIRT